MPFALPGVAHQLPYKWDSYVRPDVQFTLEPISSVIAKVNAVIREVSSNAVPEAIKLDTTPTALVKVGSNPSLDAYMNQLIADFRQNSLYVSLMPPVMECRAYRVTDGLIQRMTQQRSKGEYKVGAEPLVSALIYETDIYSWSIMVPEGPNAWSSEFRYDKVFKYVPSLNVILALTTPEEHAAAEKRLKASGLWMDIQADEKGHNQ